MYSEKQLNKMWDEEMERVTVLEDEIGLISDMHLRTAVRHCIDDRNKMLKIYPASLGGKYHPPEERVPGGLVLHIKRMIRMLNDLSKHFGLNTKDRDILLVCAFFHDISNIDLSEVDKDGTIKRDHKTYKKWHGMLSSQIATKYLVEQGFSSVDELLLIVQGILQSHMGIWYPSHRQPVNSTLEILFSAVDYLDSREYLHIDKKALVVE